MTIRDEGPSASGGGRHLDFRPGMAMWWEITRSTEDTSGELFEATNWIEPGMAAPPVHVHPSAEESYEVVDGAIEVFMDGSWSRVGPARRRPCPRESRIRYARPATGTTRILNIRRSAQNQ